jgi:hypothetical protein
MKKNLILSIGLIFLLSSCEIIDSFLNPDKAACKLIQTEWNIPNDPAKVIKDFTYNSKDQLIEVVSSEYDMDPQPYIVRYEISYANDNISELTQFTKFYSNPEEIQQQYTFFYSGNEIDSIAVKGFNSYVNLNDYMLATYDNGKLVRLDSYHIIASNAAGELFYTYDFTWTGDNITTISSQYQNGTPIITHYEYDDQNAPLNSIGLAVVSFNNYTILSKNNVIKATREGTILGGSPVIDYIITYNTNGYPVSIEETSQYQSYPTTYTYDCK